MSDRDETRDGFGMISRRHLAYTVDHDAAYDLQLAQRCEPVKTKNPERVAEMLEEARKWLGMANTPKEGTFSYRVAMNIVHEKIAEKKGWPDRKTWIEENRR